MWESQEDTIRRANPSQRETPETLLEKPRDWNLANEEK